MITWRIDATETRAIRLEWRESGLKDLKPPTRQGFGARLIGAGVRRELHGTMDVAFVPEILPSLLRARRPDRDLTHDTSTAPETVARTIVIAATDLGRLAAPTKPAPSPAAGGFPFADPAPLRVLIVEDEALIAMNLESLIEDFGFEVCAVAAMGAEAVTFARALHPEVILMDVNLIGDMDGIEAARQIREAVDARIIFVTAYGSADVLARIHAAAPDAPILSKPVASPALLDAITRTEPR